MIEIRTNSEEETYLFAKQFAESLKDGDVICFYNTGAYGYSMSSNYNRVLKPAAVLVNNGKSDIIINRQTYEQLCESDVIPDRLN